MDDSTKASAGRPQMKGIFNFVTELENIMQDLGRNICECHGACLFLSVRWCLVFGGGLLVAFLVIFGDFV